MNAMHRTLRLLPFVFCVCSVAITFVPGAWGQRAQQRATRQTKAARKNQPQTAGGNRFTSADGGRTLHDDLLHVTWLVDANVGKSECKNVDSVGGGGGMPWKAAWACVSHLNSGTGFMGHSNWQMPATPKTDNTCGAVGRHKNSFGAKCSGSSYGSLFYGAWKLRFGQTVAQQSGPATGGFSNLQPALYWYGNRLSKDTSKNSDNGYNSISFSNGWQGGNVDQHPMYIMPMIPGRLPAGSPAAKATIWDPSAESGVPGKSGISWLADANIASNQDFLGQIQASKLAINADGSMDQLTAQQLIALMRAKQYLGRNDWRLPLAINTNCHISKGGTNGGYDCNVSGMGHLYYSVFKLKSGDAVDAAPNMPEVKPFTNVQPSLYWACVAASPNSFNPQAGNLCSTTPTAASGFGFSFDMGNGFTDTTIIASDLYLMVYYPDPPSKKCSSPTECCMLAGGTMSGNKCH